jgi:hypothetical protein
MHDRVVDAVEELARVPAVRVVNWTAASAVPSTT